MFASIPLPGVRRGTIQVMSLVCGVMVANIYLCQPLLAEMARDFGVPAHTAAGVAVATQVGYALGILLIVPLADGADPAALIRRLMAFATAALLAAAVAPGVALLMAASLLIATASVVAQILIPLATTLGGAAYRGRIVSTLMTGLILGILLSRTLSGAVAEFAGSWRAPFLVQAGVVLLLRFVVAGFLPQRAPHQQTMGYVALLRSLPPLLRHEPLRLSMLLNFCTFAAFSALWATLAFQLATPAFGLGPAAAGLFGLWGAPGALLAPLAGRLSDRWGAGRVNAISLVAMAACFGVALGWGSHSLAALVIAVNLLDFGQQSGQVANQTRIFGLGEAIRGRVNTIYMVTTFTGGALGALAGGSAWAFAGWPGVCAIGIGLVFVAAAALARASFGARAMAAHEG